MTKALLVVVALTGVAAADATNVAAKLEEAVRDRDVAATQGLLADTIAIDGVRFTNAACDNRGRTASRRVLAACLVKEGFSTTTRRTATADAALVTFASGIEVEVGIEHGRVQSLATTSRSGAPALSPAALEGLRTAGAHDLDALVAARLTAPATAWLELCLDRTGAVTSSVIAGDRHAGRVFRVAIADWRFRAFSLRRTRTPICTPVSFSFPASGKPAVETIPARSGTLPAVSTALTANELVALYSAVGRKLSTLDRDAAAPLFMRYRKIQLQRMMANPDERERGATELAAIDRAIDDL